jgi:hypothetical protein
VRAGLSAFSASSRWYGREVLPAQEAAHVPRERRAHVQQVQLQRVVLHVLIDHVPHRLQRVGRTIHRYQNFQHFHVSFE